MCAARYPLQASPPQFEKYVSPELMTEKPEDVEQSLEAFNAKLGWQRPTQ
jgi:hypothetical protein